MKKAFILFLTLSSFFANAQEDTKAKNLQVIGSSKVVVTPDVGILLIHLSQIDTSFNKSIIGLGDKTNNIVKLLVSIGFKEEEIKTASFSTSKNRIYKQDGYKDSGYVAIQNVKIEFANDKNLLSKILNKLSSSKSDIDFSFEFKLSDKLKSEVQNRIIELAIIDAKQKSELMVKVSGLKLIGIKDLNYGWNQRSGMEQVETEHRYAASSAGSNSRIFNFTPEDLIFRDSVTITWGIE
jgi:uncharacterized protein